MKKICLTNVILLLQLAVLFAGSEKKHVGVLQFEAKGISENEASSVNELFTSDLVATGRFVVLDRANMNKVLAEQEFQNSGCTGTACAVQIGKILNMQYMFTGTVMKVGASMVISIKMINVESSQIEDSKKETVKSADQYAAATKKIAVRFATGKKDMIEIKEPFNGKAFLITSGLTMGTTAGIFNILGFAFADKLDQKKTLYEEAVDSDKIETYYNDYESYRKKANSFYIISWAGYGAGAGLLLWGLLSNSRDDIITMIPRLSRRQVKITLNRRY
ncbi:MAG TPA: CsgG/HfaB family protein [Spirochaetota bacterium]|nr:CsgG/HfaB family protein [Spirochaetota bacterium]